MNLATAGEFRILGESLKTNSTLLLLDLCNNTTFDENIEYISEITDCLINTPQSKLKKIRVTCKKVETINHYLELQDHKPSLIIVNSGKVLEDVDGQEE